MLRVFKRRVLALDIISSLLPGLTFGADASTNSQAARFVSVFFLVHYGLWPSSRTRGADATESRGRGALSRLYRGKEGSHVGVPARCVSKGTQVCRRRLPSWRLFALLPVLESAGEPGLTVLGLGEGCRQGFFRTLTLVYGMEWNLHKSWLTKLRLIFEAQTGVDL